MKYSAAEIEILNDYLPLRHGVLSAIANDIQNILRRQLINRDDEGRDTDIYNIYAIRSRTKSPNSLIEKIRRKIKGDRASGTSFDINKDNYKDCIDDLVGVRVICYHPSDLEEIKKLINGLEYLKIIKFYNSDESQKWENKSAFIFRSSPDDRLELPTELTEGYSTIHSKILLVKETKYKIELQLRTLLEETWGEISHFHSYKKKESPPNLKQGFYILSALLTACNLEVNYLKSEAQNESGLRRKIPDSQMRETFDKPLRSLIKEAGLSDFYLLGRLYDYLHMRFKMHKDQGCPIFHDKDPFPNLAWFEHVFSKDNIIQFRKIYSNVRGIAAFEAWEGPEGYLKKNLDLINLADFGICLCENPENHAYCETILDFTLRSRRKEEEEELSR